MVVLSYNTSPLQNKLGKIALHFMPPFNIRQIAKTKVQIPSLHLIVLERWIILLIRHLL
jgi:hypothetical protein